MIYECSIADDTLVVVTGAGRGFGKVLAQEALSRQYGVVAVCRSEVPSSLKKSAAVTIRADCSSKSDLEIARGTLVECMRAFKRIVLVNNAGHYLKAPLCDTDFKRAIETIESNVLAAVMFTRLVISIARPEVIINVVSTSGLTYSVPRSDLRFKALYAGSKQFLARLSGALEAEVSSATRVLTLFPRNINTRSDVEELDSIAPLDLARWVIDQSLTKTFAHATRCVLLPSD